MPLYGLEFDQPITPPIRVNRDSPQAFGLTHWFPGVLPHGAGVPQVFDHVTGYRNGTLNNAGSVPNIPIISHAFGPAIPLNAWSFNGSNVALVNLFAGSGNGPLPFPTAPPFSISLWIRPSTVDGYVFWYGRTDSASNISYYIYYSATNDRVEVASTNGSSFRIAYSTTGSCPENKWTHICGVWHATNDRRVYVDGQFHSQNTLSSSWSSTSLAAVCGATQINNVLGNYWTGSACDLRMYRRALSDSEVMSIYDPRTRFDLYRSERYSRPSSFLAGPSTYTGSAAVTCGAATCSGSATHTAPIYTGTAAVSIGAATASGSATFALTFTGISAVTVGSATASGTATHTAPIYTGTAAVTCGAATCSGSATHTAPSYTGTAGVSIGAATASGSATFTAPVYTGTAAVTCGAATCSGSATHTAPVYTGSAAATIGAATASGTALFATAVYSGNAAVTCGASTASGSATHTAPTFTGLASVVTAAVTAAGSATHTAPSYTGNAAVSTGPATVSGSATFTSTTRTGTAAVSTAPATASGSATFVAPAYDTGTGYVNFADQYFFGGIL